MTHPAGWKEWTVIGLTENDHLLLDAVETGSLEISHGLAEKLLGADYGRA